jgi:hypothetical protein
VGRRPPATDEDDLFEHLVMASSIIRPAANHFIREFVARMRGKPGGTCIPLERFLGETYGMAVYQEQITQIAMALADFSASEGDQLRKIISKKDKGQKLEDYRQMFYRRRSKPGGPGARPWPRSGSRCCLSPAIPSASRTRPPTPWSVANRPGSKPTIRPNSWRR